MFMAKMLLLDLKIQLGAKRTLHIATIALEGFFDLENKHQSLKLKRQSGKI